MIVSLTSFLGLSTRGKTSAEVKEARPWHTSSPPPTPPLCWQISCLLSLQGGPTSAVVVSVVDTDETQDVKRNCRLLATTQSFSFFDYPAADGIQS